MWSERVVLSAPAIGQCPVSTTNAGQFRILLDTQELGIHVITLYKWRKAWRLQGEVVPATQKDPEAWGPADKFTVVLESAGLNATELGGYCRERGLFPEQVGRWRQAAQDANAQPLLTMADQKDLEKRHQADQREIKRLQQELRRKDKALAEAAALLMASKKIQAYWGEGSHRLLLTCNQREFAALPPGQIVPTLAGPGRLHRFRAQLLSGAP
jgi:transposase-like protein